MSTLISVNLAMLTAVDSSVLLDVLIDSEYGDRSEAALYQSMSEGGLVICECVLAEIRPALTEPELTEFINDWQLSFIPSSFESALLAGSMFASYIQRGRNRQRIVADFLIGAHAMHHADRILARDRGYLRDYFKDLKLMHP